VALVSQPRNGGSNATYWVIKNTLILAIYVPQTETSTVPQQTAPPPAAEALFFWLWRKWGERMRKSINHSCVWWRQAVLRKHNDEDTHQDMMGNLQRSYWQSNVNRCFSPLRRFSQYSHPDHLFFLKSVAEKHFRSDAKLSIFFS
jgi:hypothetical protein